MITELSKGSLEEAIEFCSANSYAELDSLGIDKKKLYMKRLKDFLDSGKKILCDYEDSRIQGIILFEKLDFDTELFKAESYRITDLIARPRHSKDLVKAALSEMQSKGAEFIQAKIDSRDIEAAEALKQEGFIQVSEDVTLYKELEKAAPGNTALESWKATHDYVVEPADEKDIDALYFLSKEAYRTTRFHQDPHIKKEVADEMQGLWIRNCYHQRLADEIIVLKKNNLLAGYVACSILQEPWLEKKSIGRIVLIALQKEFRGIGAGKALIEESDAWFIRHGCSGVAVGTQLINIGAVKYYQKYGFKFIGTTLALHKWTRNK